MTNHSLVTLEGADIVIRITPEGLKSATEQGVLGSFWLEKNRYRQVEVTSMEKWRRALFRALIREREDGATPVMLMLDECLNWAAEQGEEGIKIEGIHDD